MFKRWYQSSLRHQILIWLLVINFFILLLLAVATLQVSRSSVEKNIFEQLEREHVIESEMIEGALNRMVEEVQSLGTSPTMVSALNSPNNVDQLLESFAKRNPSIKEDRDDFYLLDANLNRLHVIGNSSSWVDGSRALAKSALSQLKIQAGVFKTDNGFILQLAQPIEARGVVVISQPINQLLGRFFQGRKDIAAWALEDGSGQVLSNLSDSASPDQTIVRELFEQPKISGNVDHRSASEQIEHWSQIGKIAQDNPDLPFSMIREILIADQEQAIAEYVFR